MRLLTFGGLALESPHGSAPPRLRPQRLAILALLAAAGDRGVSRERMAALFWPEADEEHARQSLRQALYALRQELGADVIRADASLALDRAMLSSDVGEFRAALAAGVRDRAIALVNGPFLDGFHLAGADGFERWMEDERASIATDASRALLGLAKDAESEGDLDAAADWWRRLTLLDPLSGRFALGYLKALAARGDRAGALAFARAHESLVQRELESDADPDIRKLETELRAMASPVVAHVPPSVRAAVSGAPEPVPRPARTRAILVAAGAAVLIVATIVTADIWRPSRLGASGGKLPTFAVGLIAEQGVPDTLRIGGVLTDMLATNMARVAGLPVLANTRLVELMHPGQDTLPAGYSDAARRAGATEILQGRLLPGPQWGLAMEMQRVDLATGLVKGAYRVSAPDRYALIDSMTAAIARDLHLGSPAGSVAEATTESPAAYRLYEEGLHAYYQYDDAAARRLMQAALREDSTFAMAAYFDARLSREGDGDETARRTRALRLAARAPERDRLMITADVLEMTQDPSALVVAESLAARYPRDPRALALLSGAHSGRGNWSDAAAVIERAIAIDSAAEPVARQSCRLCDDFTQLANVYLWWDSLPAADRTARRFTRLRPMHHYPWHVLAATSAARGDTAALRTNLRQFHASNPLGVSPDYFVRRLILAEQYDEAARVLAPLLESPRPVDGGLARWLQSILLRNQGRADEAGQRARNAHNDLAEALVALEQEHPRVAVTILGARARSDESPFSPGVKARHLTWNKTLYGMALAAVGDTNALRALADTVESWGEKSSYGRDRRAHHYLRGMLAVARHRDEEAVVELREAMHSPTNGFTRVNYELGRALLRLNRAAEAVPVVRAALHGDIDGSNLYMTRTDLHELLAQSFDRTNARDSAAVHYRAVVGAWATADPLYHARRERARAWLAEFGRGEARGVR